MVRRLIVIGRGVTAERMAELGGQLGYDVISVGEDVDAMANAGPDDHVVIAEEDTTRARRLLLAAAQAPELPGYLGYAAPQREGLKALVALAAEKVSKERIDAISAPAGVDVGAETPAEVAIAVAAELVALRRGRTRPSAGLTPGSSRRAGLAKPRRWVDALPRGPGKGRN